MKVLIKLGGTLLESLESRQRLANEITQILDPEQYQMAVVHGGGKLMTRFLAERGVESQFVNGLRVTTPDVIDAVVKVFRGTVNSALVTAFRAAGAHPVGLSGLDAGLVDAEVLDPALGLVGRPVASNPRVVEVLTREGFLPVIACIAGDSKGTVYNVNADQMAVACAVAFGCEKLLFLTDVDGVRGATGEIETTLTAGQARDLIAQGIATGGMQAKLESALDALQRGVREVWIAPGASPGVTAALLNNLPVGTRIVL